jgi:DNA modification methylase
MVSKRSTKTRSFGVGKRENHDSSTFYAAKLYGSAKTDEKASEAENPAPAEFLDKILLGDSRKTGLPDSCVHLMVTSPPYNVGKDYDKNLNLNEYFGMLREVFAETHRVLVTGGRACINIANVGRKPYIPYHKHVIDAMTEVGFLMRGEIIWQKAAGANGNCAWGSWQSASNPTLRDTHEYILIFSKGKFGRKKTREDTISKDEFLEYTKSIWNFPPESAKKIGHPAPFPVELPYRCIQLYTFRDEVVLDPFGGLASTAMAAKKAGRHYICYEVNEEYVEKAKKRVTSAK